MAKSKSHKTHIPALSQGAISQHREASSSFVRFVEDADRQGLALRRLASGNESNDSKSLLRSETPLYMGAYPNQTVEDKGKGTGMRMALSLGRNEAKDTAVHISINIRRFAGTTDQTHCNNTVFANSLLPIFTRTSHEIRPGALYMGLTSLDEGGQGWDSRQTPFTHLRGRRQRGRPSENRVIISPQLLHLIDRMVQCLLDVRGSVSEPVSPEQMLLTISTLIESIRIVGNFVQCDLLPLLG
ncbi:hypothetical protein GGS20DRAFT_596402 [Poronia punctata]|nr:hypothetical protein GGS20DRAFT_596402 [Poronia punctata]